MDWISVKDRLPECDNFLGTDGEVVFAAYWCRDAEQYKVGGWEICYYCGGASSVSLLKKDYTNKKITHWMPLPEPAKQEDDNPLQEIEPNSLKEGEDGVIAEWGGSARCMTSDGRNVNIAEELNRLKKELLS